MDNAWRIVTELPEYLPDIADELRLFLGDIALDEDRAEYALLHSCRMEEGLWQDSMEIRQGDRVLASHREGYPLVTGSDLEIKKHRKRAVKLCAYAMMKAYTGEHPAWGSLTGIRPTRLLYQAMEQGETLENAARVLAQIFDVQPERAALLTEIIKAQQSMLQPREDDMDVYIGIPFCRTVCHYCSFAAQPIPEDAEVDQYMRALLSEMRAVSVSLGKRRFRSVYIGGGTPTSLSAEHLDRLLSAAGDLFAPELEYTVEAGRPDTLDVEKLRLMQEHGVQRISINPQTLHDETLRRIGRDHTSEDIRRTYEMARELLDARINMDVIAMLPGETLGMFQETMGKLMEMAPDNVTVHTLSVKKTSALRLEQGAAHTPQMEEAREMVDYARNALAREGYVPYYLYRQKYTADNLENVGYAKPNTGCVYNVDQMEETTSIVAFGAGSISKAVRRRGHMIRRAANVRNVAQYMERWEEMARRKIELFEQ